MPGRGLSPGDTPDAVGARRTEPPWGDPAPPRATPRGPGECRRDPHGPDLPCCWPPGAGSPASSVISPALGRAGLATPHPTGDATCPGPAATPAAPHLAPSPPLLCFAWMETAQGRALAGRGVGGASTAGSQQAGGQGPGTGSVAPKEGSSDGTPLCQGQGTPGAGLPVVRILGRGGHWALGRGRAPRVGCAGYCLPVSPSSQPRLSPSRKCRGPPARPPRASGNPLPIRSEGRNVPLPQAQACLPQGPHQPSLTRPSPWPGTAGRSGLLGGGVLSLLEARPERRLAGEDSGQGLISSRVGGGGDGGQVEA